MGARLAVIIPSYCHFGYCLRAVKSLFACTDGEVEAYLIDDASPEWLKQDWSKWPTDKMQFQHFSKNGGLTRSWNCGLRMARERGAEFVCAANSDIIFSPGWFDNISWALTRGVDLAGPVTNAPGHRPKQRVTNFLKDYKVTDDASYLAKVAARLRGSCSKSFLEAGINGFCMVAKTSTWWSGAFDANNVFNPKFKLTGNEDELQRRWRKQRKTLAIVPGSFVFHYRGVSRKHGASGKHGKGWFRIAKK